MFSSATPEHRGPLVQVRVQAKPPRVQQPEGQPGIFRPASEHATPSGKWLLGLVLALFDKARNLSAADTYDNSLELF